MRVKHDILDISLFITFYDYDFAMLWDIEGDILKERRRQLENAWKKFW